MSDSSIIATDRGAATVVGFRDQAILDVLTIQQIARELYDLIGAAPNRNLILDFGNVRFLSSQALGVLLQLRRKADASGAKVVLCQLRPELARVFKITNLDKMFEFFDDLNKALKRFGIEP